MKKILVALALLLVLIFMPNYVKASADFSVVPSKLELPVEAGKSVEKKLTVTNSGKSELEFSVEIQDYTITEDNEFIYYPPGELKHSAAAWLTVSPTVFTLGADQKQEITVTFNVPSGVDSRGYQSILLISAKNAKSSQKEGATLNIVGRIGVVLLGEVVPATGGEALKREGEIQDVKLSVSFPPFIEIKNGNLSLNFKGLYRPDVKATVFFKNTGLTHITLSGTVSFLSQYFGFKETVELPNITTLPDSVRKLEASWSKPVFFGPISARVNLTWENGPKLEETVSAFVIPWNLLYFLLILIVIVSLITWMTVKRHIQHKKLQAMMEELLKHEAADKTKTKGKGKKAKVKEEPVFQQVRQELEEIKEKKHPGWRIFGWLLLFAAVIVSAAVIGMALGRLFTERGAQKETPQIKATETPTFTVPAEVSPLGTSETTATVTPTLLSGETYTVKSGDSLFSIGQKFGVDWHEIAELNNLNPPYLLHPGDVLKIPQK